MEQQKEVPNLQTVTYMIGQLQRTTDEGFRSQAIQFNNLDVRVRALETWQAVESDRVKRMPNSGQFAGESTGSETSPTARYVTIALIGIGTLLSLIEYLVRK